MQRWASFKHASGSGKVKLRKTYYISPGKISSHLGKFPIIFIETGLGRLITLWDPDFFNAEAIHSDPNFILLQGNLKAPVLMGGDFNIVLSVVEKVGASVKKREMEEFSDFIEQLNLMDLPLLGSTLTWSNLRDAPSFSRLYRFLLSPEALALWPSMLQKTLPRNVCDHNPISLSIENKQWGPKPFNWFDH
ncbi:hypothetical protein V6N13_003404 [Hibiscus sabdariffa]